MITFRVVSTPVPKGSLRAFMLRGRPVLTSTSRDLKTWAAAVAEAARQAIPVLYPRGIGIHVAVVFVLPRPVGLPKTKRRDHTVKPDVDKLLRALLDALTGIAYADDSQVCRAVVDKRYAALTEQPGAIVTLDRTREARDSIVELDTYERVPLRALNSPDSDD